MLCIFVLLIIKWRMEKKGKQADKMKKFCSVLELICSKSVYIMASIILLAFTYWAGKYTHMTYVDLENLKVRLYEDNWILNICCLLGVLILFWIISGCVLSENEERNKWVVRRIAFIASILVGVVGVFWVMIHHYRPDHDQLQIVVDAMAFLEKDYSDLKGYLEIYPHQIGLVFLYKVLFSIVPTYEIIYYVHVVWLMCIVYFTYAVTQELFEDSRASLYSIFGSVFFVPMYFYVNYAYGDLCMAACGILGAWLLIKYCKYRRSIYAVFLIGVMTCSYLARANSIIIIIAMVIVLLIHGLKKLDWRIILLAGMLLLIPIAVQKSIITYYEQQAGVEMVEGAPAILHIAMGMQDTYEGPGYYNAYNLSTYIEAGKDANAAAETGKKYINERMKEMSADLEYTMNFYKLKICQQWNEPSFGGEVATNYFSDEPTGLVKNIYFGEIQNLLRIFRDKYIFILYAGALVSAVSAFIYHKENKDIWRCLTFIILIGGFLFSIIWENKSRYVMPYVVLLLPNGACGLLCLQTWLKKGIKQLKRKVIEIGVKDE